jgi:hypothetical protein
MTGWINLGLDEDPLGEDPLKIFCWPDLGTKLLYILPVKPMECMRKFIQGIIGSDRQTAGAFTDPHEFLINISAAYCKLFFIFR